VPLRQLREKDDLNAALVRKLLQRQLQGLRRNSQRPQVL
jgi:hypothetical protein